MADEVTSENKTPEVIEREMLQTRESLTEKVAALENQVVGTVQTAADTLTGTVEAVKSFVQTAPEAVTETVKSASSALSDALKDVLDVSGRVRSNPWGAVGLSAAVGAAVGYMSAAPRRGLMGGLSEEAVPRAGAVPAAPPTPRPGVFDELFGLVGGKLRELAEVALNSASASLRSAVEARVPHLVDGAASALTERLSDAEPAVVAGRFDGRRSAGS